MKTENETKVENSAETSSDLHTSTPFTPFDMSKLRFSADMQDGTGGGARETWAASAERWVLRVERENTKTFAALMDAFSARVLAETSPRALISHLERLKWLAEEWQAAIRKREKLEALVYSYLISRGGNLDKKNMSVAEKIFLAGECARDWAVDIGECLFCTLVTRSDGDHEHDGACPFGSSRVGQLET